MHGTRARVGFSRGPWSEKKQTERTKERQEGTKRGKWPNFPPPGGPKSGIFDARCCGLICKNVLPAEGRKHFSKKVSKN